MAIRKNAKNVTVTVKSNYQLNVGGRLEKTASQVNVESVKEDIKLSCLKKIISLGNKT